MDNLQAQLDEMWGGSVVGFAYDHLDSSLTMHVHVLELGTSRAYRVELKEVSGMSLRRSSFEWFYAELTSISVESVPEGSGFLVSIELWDSPLEITCREIYISRKSD